MAARKLRPYFQAHTIKVLTGQPLRQILHRPDTSGRLVKWVVELSEFDIKYLPRPAIRAQVLADFIAECTMPDSDPGSEAEPVISEQQIEAEAVPLPGLESAAPPTSPLPCSEEPLWEVYVDGSSNKSGSGAGLVLTGPDGFVLNYALSKFASFEVIRVPRTENTKADVLSKLAASGYTALREIRMEFLKTSSIDEQPIVVMQIDDEPCWMDEIIRYLRSGELPGEKKEARKVVQRAARFSLDGETLYKRSYTLPYLKCLRPTDALYALRETHEGICGEHLGDLKIEQKFTSVAHPQTNGQTEVTNRTLLQGIKKRLDDKAGRWADELYHVLGAYRTTPRTATGESPFNLSFGTEAVISVDIGIPSPRIVHFNEQLNRDGLRVNLDLLEEVHEESEIRAAAYKQKVSRYHDTKIRPREFRTGNLVLRKAAVSQSRRVGKLYPTWAGPYRIKEVIRPGSYRLETLDEQLLPHAWNSRNL
ncbi:uncharacterized protein LOC143888821 [Tasmannia lanceolata]|uniref:uncharacterized protein LOC143888819 n=1 Tax=Tasmannia lanceolata TaxID=3420 RepID=UPI004064922B